MADWALKTESLRAIDAERASWNALVAEVGNRRSEPDIQGHWSFRDIAQHINDWRSRSLDVLEAEARLEPPPPAPWPVEFTTDDEINRWFHERARIISDDDVFDRAQILFVRLYRFVVGLPSPILADPDALPMLEGQSLASALTSRAFFSHVHDEHEPAIRRWLQRGKPLSVPALDAAAWQSAGLVDASM
jgi:hypothetical protein